MKNVVVTGASGFIGKNLCAQLEVDGATVLRIDRQTSLTTLEAAIDKVDFIFHLAGVNRPQDEDEFKAGNQHLTEQVIDIVSKSGRQIPILLSSSTQAELANPYGKSKKGAEDAVRTWSEKSNSPVYIFRLTNVFGKWSRPNYNSVVATFCSNLANGKPIQINDPASQLSLIYIDDVVSTFINALYGKVTPSPDGFCHIKPIFNISVGDLATKLREFNEIRNTLIIPQLQDQFDKYLYATFTSYFADDNFSYQLDTKSDDRGWLAEIIKSDSFGQVFVSKTIPGISRGNHWHHTKIEKFLVIEGSAEIRFRNFATKEIITYSVNGETLEVVDIPAGYVHSITNVGTSDLLTIFWADEIFDSNKPDTYYEEV